MKVHVAAVLAHGPGQPDGDTGDRLDLWCTLTPHGALDEHARLADPEPWAVRRTRPDMTERASDLVRLEGSWALQSQRHEDEPLWSVEAKLIRPGDYIILMRPDSEELMFRIVNVKTAA